MLKGYIAPTTSVPVPGSVPLAVRGLSLNDIAHVVANYRPEIEAVFKQFEGVISGKGIAALDLAAVMTVTMNTAPLLAATLIALAVDEPDEVETVTKLPITVQLACIEALGTLTFDGEGGAKKVFEAVLKVLGGAGRLVNRAPDQPRRAEIRIGSDGMPTSDPA